MALNLAQRRFTSRKTGPGPRSASRPGALCDEPHSSLSQGRYATSNGLPFGSSSRRCSAGRAPRGTPRRIPMRQGPRLHTRGRRSLPETMLGRGRGPRFVRTRSFVFLFGMSMIGAGLPRVGSWTEVESHGPRCVPGCSSSTAGNSSAGSRADRTRSDYASLRHPWRTHRDHRLDLR